MPNVMQKPSYYWNEFKRRPLARHLTLIALTLVVLAVAAHVLMLAGTRHGARRTVPDFSGMPLAEAERTARDNDLDLFINDSLYVPAYEGGIVLDQLPEGGVEVKPGRTVYITINSFRQKMVPVPYVAGRSLRQAKNMLEIAGLAIDRIVYRADMATNYVLAEYCDGREVHPSSRMEAEAGTGITLHVGVEGGYGTVVTPNVTGYPLAQAKGRLWELGLNVGRIEFDEGINLLNQKEARVYLQSPGQERSVALGTDVNLRLTLDTQKAAKVRAEAEKSAKALAEERVRQEQAAADSLARAQLEQALTPPAPQTEASETPAQNEDTDGFFF